MLRLFAALTAVNLLVFGIMPVGARAGELVAPIGSGCVSTSTAPIDLAALLDPREAALRAFVASEVQARSSAAQATAVRREVPLREPETQAVRVWGSGKDGAGGIYVIELLDRSGKPLVEVAGGMTGASRAGGFVHLGRVVRMFGNVEFEPGRFTFVHEQEMRMARFKLARDLQIVSYADVRVSASTLPDGTFDTAIQGGSGVAIETSDERVARAHERGLVMPVFRATMIASPGVSANTGGFVEFAPMLLTTGELKF